MSMITVCILAKNARSTIAKTLESTSSFSEVIVLDNGSTDDTVEIAKHFSNVRVIETPFIGFGPLRNKATSLASNDWILALDTDEVLSMPLLKELQVLTLTSNTVYALSRENYYNGKHIKGCGWHPDKVVRLYHRKTTQYTDAWVHESVITKDLLIHPLKGALLHEPFRATAEFLNKMQHYSSLFAKQHRGQRKSSFQKAFWHSLFTFFRSYFLQKGWRLGKEGFIISLYNSNTVFYKYVKLWEENEN